MTRARIAIALATAAGALATPDVAGALRLSVPLDHSGAVPGQVTVALRGLDSESGEDVSRPPVLLLPEEPGGVVSPYDLARWNYLMPRRNVVAMVPRGSGRRPLRCRDLEAAARTDAGREAAACAALLGDRRGFFRAADTVEDLELLRQRIGVERLTLIGPGYGSYVVQRYALRYPQHVSRLILSSVVDAPGADPLLRDSAAAAPRVLRDLCRGPACDRFTTDPAADTRRLVGRLAAAPLEGAVVGPRGRRHATTLTPQDLLFALLQSDTGPLQRADFPAAVASALRGDGAPLLRLKARAVRTSRLTRPRSVSAAAAAAATCEETRFPWDWHASPAERAEAAQRAAAGMDPTLADPFDPGALVRSEPMRLCGRWPTASPEPPEEPGAMPDVPALVLAGSSELRRPAETARRTVARFPRGTLLVASDASPDDACAGVAIWRFMHGKRVQDRCGRSEPPVPVGDPMPTSLRELPAFRGVPGRRGRLLSAFAASFGDLVDDFFANFFSNANVILHGGVVRGGGLRGGRYLLAGETVELRRYEFVPGVRISGRWLTDDDRGRERPLRIDGPGRLDGRVRLREDFEEDLLLHVRGRIAGRPVRVRMKITSRLIDAIEESFDGGTAGAAALPLLP